MSYDSDYEAGWQAGRAYERTEMTDEALRLLQEALMMSDAGLISGWRDAVLRLKTKAKATE